jgi:hypothetical protein
MKSMHQGERSTTGSSHTASFAAVAEIIAKGPPPEWLVQVLEGWAIAPAHVKVTPDVYRQYKRRLRQMQDAVDTLIELFPLFNREVDDLISAQVPVSATFIEFDLPSLRAWLAAIGDNDKGRRPHHGRELVADFICHFWKRIHGKAEPRSDRCYLACEEYWLACGGEPSGDIHNWRRMVEDAATRDELFLTHNMLIQFVGGTELKQK